MKLPCYQSSFCEGRAQQITAFNQADISNAVDIVCFIRKSRYRLYFTKKEIVGFKTGYTRWVVTHPVVSNPPVRVTYRRISGETCISGMVISLVFRPTFKRDLFRDR